MGWPVCGHSGPHHGKVQLIHHVRPAPLGGGRAGQQSLQPGPGEGGAPHQSRDGPDTPCVGYASGIGRILDALEAEEVELPINDSLDLFLLYVNDEEKKNALSGQMSLFDFAIRVMLVS